MGASKEHCDCRNKANTGPKARDVTEVHRSADPGVGIEPPIDPKRNSDRALTYAAIIIAADVWATPLAVTLVFLVRGIVVARRDPERFEEGPVAKTAMEA
jgi:hypothetical protein